MVLLLPVVVTFVISLPTPTTSDSLVTHFFESLLGPWLATASIYLSKGFSAACCPHQSLSLLFEILDHVLNRVERLLLRHCLG